MRSLTAVFAATLALSLLAASSNEKTSDDKSATEKSAGNAARLNNLGVAYMNQQSFERGLKNFEAAAAADPKLGVARLNQAIALLNLQRVDEAKSLLEEAVKKDPKNATAWYNLGLLYKNSGELVLPWVHALAVARVCRGHRRVPTRDSVECHARFRLVRVVARFPAVR